MDNHQDHDVLIASCSSCGGAEMLVQISDEHGLTIACSSCHSIVFNAQNGDHFNSVIRKLLDKGCVHEKEHEEERKN